MIHYQPIPNTDIDQVAKLKDYCFKTSLDSSRSPTFRYWVKKSTALGAYDNQKLVSQLLILPFQMNIFGVPFEMGGVATVSTYPEYREGGVTKQLLLQSLEKMRENNQSISVLSPFSVSFYRHFGWELFFENTRYTILSEELVVRNRVEGRVVRFDYGCPDSEKWMERIQEFHKKEVARRHGNQYRDDMWWERIKERNPDSCYAISLNEKQQIEGYMRYEIQKKEFQVKDFYASCQDAEKKLWQFIQAHASQVTTITGTSPAQDSFGFHFTNPEVKREIYFEKMIRIVDVEQFLRQFPFKKIKAPLYVKVKDKKADWNNHIFKIEGIGKVGKVVSDVPANVLEMEIGPFSAMMMGYHSLGWYSRNGYAHITSEEMIHWETAIPCDYPAYHDYF